MSDDYDRPQHSRQAAFSLLWLFVFSCMMFTLPFAAFYGVQHWVRTHWADATPFEATAYAVLASVVVVNAIIGGYCLLAYCETEYDAEGREVDQSVCGGKKAAAAVADGADAEPTDKKTKKKKKSLKEQ